MPQITALIIARIGLKKTLTLKIFAEDIGFWDAEFSSDFNGYSESPIVNILAYGLLTCCENFC